ncbi:serine protease inhibitor Kazal-type 5 isoform X2 [Hippopotamus amphibius kiboko]|uniref:serine protease inhibitor Kazal-type 5 isoform X2 n=1 Tax=Hippopotamus amphibius kiboko TaxID=575201 RepID=UPI00259524E5|nr:serine protease inhibitor Kazal-type 5 isoform X2 [Hippopotamus amphibius kiboko]
MKTATVPVLLTLALCLIQDAASEDENQETCNEFRALMKNGKLFCSEDKKLFQSPDGIMFINKCAKCKMILEKEAKSQRRTRHLARATRATAKDICSDFRPYVKDGRLGCTRENDPVLGPDGRTHGNKCAMCAELFLKEAEENAKREGETRIRRSAEKNFCKEYENQVRNGRLFCTRENDPVRGPDGRMHGNKCALCAEIFKQRFSEEKNKADEHLRKAKEKVKVKSKIEELCSEYQDHAKNGKLFCTRENDPVRGPDGKMHGNLCSMCQAVYQAEAEEKKKSDAKARSKRESGKAPSYAELCSEYRNYVRNGRLPCTRENDPIEGPDGKIHGNTCSMCEAFFQQEAKEKEAGSRRTKREAEKDTCSEFRSLLQNGSLFCTRENDPVRGPDGKTHGNKCAMCKAVFQKEDEERKRKEEEEWRNAAGDGSNGNRGGKDQDQCAEYRKQMKNGKLSCTREKDPVRGTDGKSYNNKCTMCKEILQREAEENKKLSGYRSNGTESASGQDVCNEFRSQMKNGQLICTRESDPVQGPDGKTHGNKCTMCKEKLEREAAERKNKEEDYTRNTNEKNNGKEDLCREFQNMVRNGKLICTRENDPVRGPYGKMHVNKCAMCQSLFEREASERKQNKEEKLSHVKDECRNFREYVRNDELMCTREYDPVRDADGKLYKNKCYMCRTIFQKEVLERKRIQEKPSHLRSSEEEDSPKSSISSLNSEMCKHYRVLPRMGYLCPKDIHPVCGDDGQTYNNPCMLCHENLIRQTNIYIRSEGRCEENNIPETTLSVPASVK